MNNPIDGNGMSPELEIRHLCGKLLDMSLEDSEVARLNELLLQSSAAREYYFQLMQLHSLVEPSCVAVQVEKSQEDTAQKSNQNPGVFPKIRGAWDSPYRWLTLIAALVGAFAAILFVNSGNHDVVGDESFEGRNEIFARIERVASAKFPNGGKTWYPGNHLITGETLEIDSGLALLRFENNAEVIVEGPARIEFTEGSNFHLHAGKATIRDPGNGQGFVVSTPLGVFKNNRVEYGLFVDNNKSAHVEVFIGTVQVGWPRAGSLDAKNSFVLEAGERHLLSLDQNGLSQKPKIDANPTYDFVRFLPAGSGGSQEAVLSIATDGFGQGKTGSLVGSSTGGFGWVGGWRSDRVDNQSAAVVFFDGQAVSQGSGDGAVWRHVAPTLRDSSPVYFSCVLSVDGVDPVCSVWMALFKFDDATLNNGEGNLATIGISDGRFCGRMSNLRSVVAQKEAGDFGKYRTGNSHLVVGKLEFNIDGGDTERLSVWVDPTRNEQDFPDRVIEYDTGFDDFDTVAIRFWDFEHGTVGRVDDVRVSKSWDDAVR